jgi:hypothetical protein
LIFLTALICAGLRQVAVFVPAHCSGCPMSGKTNMEDRISSARPQIVNYAIDASVEAIAGRKKRAGKKLLIGLWKRRMEDRIVGGRLGVRALAE